MRFVFVILLYLIITRADAQTSAPKIYNPYANAQSDIAEAIKKAKAEKKHVLIQAGGNWCGWCIEFNRFTHADRQIDSLLRADFIVYHLNYSPEEKNSAILARYKFPQRFGFPVFLVLDEHGNLLHTQNSAYLEQGKSYNKGKVLEFLTHWNRVSLSSAIYKTN